MKARIRKEVDRTHNIFNSSMSINEKLVKDGYIYLFRGDKEGMEEGFHSKLYDKGIKLCHIQNSLEEIAEMHILECESPFISTTSTPIVAALYSNRRKVYLLRIPLRDVYEYTSMTSYLEREYLVPDIIAKEEIIKTFNHDDIKEIYYYLVNNIGLNVTPDDLGIEGLFDIEKFDINELYKLESFFETSDTVLDKMMKSVEKQFIEHTGKLENNYKIYKK